MSNLTDSIFLVPIVGYPIVLAYNFPQFNDTLKMTKELLAYIAKNNTITWNDPMITELNPALENVPTAVRMVFNGLSEATNQFIIDYLFETEENRGGSWKDLADSRYVRALGFSSVLSSLSVLSNAMALVPLPSLSSTANTNVKMGILDGVLPSTNTPTALSQSTNSPSILTASAVSKWPLNIYAYASFEQTIAATDCKQIVQDLRFLYWSYNTSILYNQTSKRGFYVFEESIYHQMQDHLFHAKCQNHPVLTYTNLSPTTRTNIVFGITTPLMGLFLLLVAASWVIRKDRRNALLIFTNSIVILGLLFSFSSFVIWWYPPSSTTLCVSRFWLFGLGFTNVIAAVYIYVFSINIVLSKAKLSHVMLGTKDIFIAYGLLLGLEIVILVLWTVIEDPIGHEVITDQLRWNTLYECKLQHGILDIVQIVYFCLICLFGCYVIYKHWSPKEGTSRMGNATKRLLEDTKWHLMALSSELGLFIVFLVVTRIVHFTDDELYPITVPIHTVLIGNVTAAFFLPRLWSRIKERRSSKGISSDLTTIGAVSEKDFHISSVSKKEEVMTVTFEMDQK